MSNWKRWLGMGRPSKKERLLAQGELGEKVRLYKEICQAHQDWEAAMEKLHYVKDVEQIDYVIYLQEASEKRYEMLLKQAKRMNLNVRSLHQEVSKLPLRSGKAMEG